MAHTATIEARSQLHPHAINSKEITINSKAITINSKAIKETAPVIHHHQAAKEIHRHHTCNWAVMSFYCRSNCVSRSLKSTLVTCMSRSFRWKRDWMRWGVRVEVTRCPKSSGSSMSMSRWRMCLEIVPLKTIHQKPTTSRPSSAPANYSASTSNTSPKCSVNKSSKSNSTPFSTQWTNKSSSNDSPKLATQESASIS